MIFVQNKIKCHKMIMHDGGIENKTPTMCDVEHQAVLSSGNSLFKGNRMIFGEPDRLKCGKCTRENLTVSIGDRDKKKSVAEAQLSVF